MRLAQISAELAKVREELEIIKSSRSYRLQKAIVGSAKGLLPYAIMRRRLMSVYGIRIAEPQSRYFCFVSRLQGRIKSIFPSVLVRDYREAMRALNGGRNPPVVDASEPLRLYASVGDFLRGVAAAGFLVSGADCLAGESRSGLVLLVSHESSLTGAPIALLLLANELRRQGKSPVFISFRDGPLREKIIADGLPYLVVERHKCPDFVSRACGIVDFVVLNTIEAADVASRLNGSLVPVMWWIHESAASYDYGLSDLPKRLSGNIHVYCVGRYAKGELLCRCPDYRVREFLYGLPDSTPGACVQLPSPLLPSCPGKRILLCVGTFCERKGQQILVAAIRRMTQVERERIAVVFIGLGVTEDIKEAMAEFPGAIYHVESVDPHLMPSIYRSVDVLVCPSFDDPMPVVVTEAMMCGVPVICSEKIGTYQLPNAAKAGFWYPDNDAEELCARIRDFLGADKTLLEEKKEVGRKIYQELFSAEAFSRRVRQMLVELGA